MVDKSTHIIKDVYGVYAKALPDIQRHLLPGVLFACLRGHSIYVSDVASRMKGVSIGAKEIKFLRLLHPQAIQSVWLGL
ncbi:MAG TPA: hypothetical protein VI935_00135 [Thermodesulfobacteriota bacterium]|nr:hypothetical protein [Thermodesulfobacteriota bacterium]